MEYGEYYDGEFCTVYDLDDALRAIKIRVKNNEKTIERLQGENARLKEEYYKDNELSAMKKELSDTKRMFQKLIEDYNRGFPISKEEDEKIEAWKRKHLEEAHGAKTSKERLNIGGAIGGVFKYEFTPTSIGVIGRVKCHCGEEHIFQEIC